MHRPVTGNGAARTTVFAEALLRRGFPLHLLGEINAGIAAKDRFITVKIPRFPRRARIPRMANLPIVALASRRAPRFL